MGCIVWATCSVVVWLLEEEETDLLSLIDRSLFFFPQQNFDAQLGVSA